MDSETMAGDAEAAGAIAGMIETYGVAVPTDARVFTIYVSPTCGNDGSQYTIHEYQCLGLLPGDLAALRFVHGGKPHGSIFFHHTRSAGPLYNSRREAIDAVAAALDCKWQALGAQINTLRDLSGRLSAVVPHVEDIA
jgi:hypothetical protein